jgi:hypothetical protein
VPRPRSRRGSRNRSSVGSSMQPSKELAPPNRPRLHQVQHAAEQRAHVANASLPPAARACRATRQAAAAALQGSGSGSEPDAATGWANPQAGALSRCRRLRATAEVEAKPV